MRKDKIILSALGLLLSASLLTACSSNNTNSSSSSSSSAASSAVKKSSSASSSSTSSSSASTSIAAFTNNNLTNEAAQLLVAWTIKVNNISDGKPAFQVFYGSSNTFYLLNTGASGTNGSTEISTLMHATSKVVINSDGTYSLEALDTTVSNTMSQNPFGAGPWNTLQTLSLDELNSSYSSQIGSFAVSLNAGADPSVLAE